jgi:uncharacterized membrane protein
LFIHWLEDRNVSIRGLVVGVIAFFIALSTLSLSAAVVSFLLLRPILFILCILGFLTFLAIAFFAALVWGFAWVLFRPH